ncbi:MAG: hypothetical protein KQH59_14945 [Desulfobulbaceae bacterium]|nr:hypothetical protein [Desulfobulbaceae bacterium]
MNSSKTYSLILIITILLMNTLCHAEIIFSDNFDSQPDWNSSQDPNLLNHWDEVLSQNRGGAYEALYISTNGENGSQGKGVVQYWDSTTGYSYAQDNWLIKNNIHFPNEWYLGYWFQHDPEWDWGGVSSLKLLKVHFNDGSTWDIYATNFCAACPEWRVPSGAGFSWCTDDAGRNWAGSWNDLGGQWHYFIWHFNHSEGILELTVDGINAMKTDYSTSYPGSGWDSGYGISFGGNISNGGGGKNEMWTKYDDIIIATSLNEVTEFLGVTPAGNTDPPSTGEDDHGDTTDYENVTILLSESFDDPNLGNRGWYDSAVDSVTVVNDQDRPGKVLEVEYELGSVTSTMNGSMRHLFNDSSELTFRYFVKYDTNWLWNNLGYGPHEFYFLSNADHAWKGPAQSHFTSYVETVGSYLRLAFQDALNIDTANINRDLTNLTEDRAVFGCNGDSDGYSGLCYQSNGAWINTKIFDSSTTLTTGAWHSIQISMKLNSFENGVAIADGKLKLFVDNIVSIDLSNILFKTSSNNFLINQILFGPYFHNGAINNQKFWLDDLLIIDKFIDSPINTETPQNLSSE